MRLPSVPHIPVVHGLKLFWDRVTFSRLTKIYFIFSVLHCIVQVVFQVQAFVANADAAKFLGGLIVTGNATDPGFAVYEGDLRMCDTVPASLDASSCTVVWDGHTTATPISDAENYVASSSISSTSAVASAAATTSTLSSATSSFSSAISLSSAPSSSVASSSTVSSASTVRSSSAASASSSAAATSTVSTATASIATTTASRTISTVTVTATASSTPKVNIQDNESDSESESEDEGDAESDSEEESDDEEDAAAVPQSLHHKRSIVLPETKIRLALNGTSRVNLQGLDGKFEVDLPRKCLYALNWPVDSVENTKREDIAFIAFQIWLLGMSLVALLNESIPHVVASLLTHILATAWGGFQISNTEVFHKKFTALTTKGACGINLLPDYWKNRNNAEIPSLALNCFALLVSAFLSWRLMKTFGWQTFKRVGASRTINRVYNMVLMFSIAIQLSLFFVGTSAALWIDQVYNGNIGRLTQQPHVFKAVMITVLALLIPWLSTGWISVRKEYRIRMMAFLAVAVLILVGWATMFIAPTFRWTYATWLFFSLMTTAAVLLILTTLILGIFCRINFGKGLTRYLNAHEELTDSAYNSPVEKTYDSEKFAFPSNDDPVPTYSVTFGSGQEVPPPSQMRFSPPRGSPPRSLGPRFYSGTTLSSDFNPFVTPTNTEPSVSSNSTSPTLSRQTSRSSQRSTTSTNSAGSQNSTGTARSKRWVIE
ncbi:hypothetical protein L227DRAFT_522304 [Lentinus tigrinus ALCF2SS1-6]|uniref:PalH-domain-containing protein n=1 Tax=Lentinus tigrinus ALCF2SS1-6 TaxID=1328759 RepID=A0A5C2SHV4_9APHY|nr:hypothetical protein L227DRAFT_522304 [Lentinus tigrinus ALCF2SS1-6]